MNASYSSVQIVFPCWRLTVDVDADADVVPDRDTEPAARGQGEAVDTRVGADRLLRLQPTGAVLYGCKRAGSNGIDIEVSRHHTVSHFQSIEVSTDNGMVHF